MKLAYLSMGIVSVIIFATVRYVLLFYHLRTARNAQSKVMAIQTPITPNPR